MAWVDDGQGAVKAGDSPTEFVVEGKPKSGTPVNARWSAPVTPERPYFEVDVRSVSEGAFIGITTLASFKKGWGCKGLLFGGNLSSGGGLVRQEFGDDVTPGSTIGVLTEFLGDATARKVQVTFWQNGKCLGPAFLSSLRNSGAEVFPLVQANENGDRFNIRFGPAPDMAAAPAGPTADPREGEWCLQVLKSGPDLAKFPLLERLHGEEGGRSFATPNSGSPDGVFVKVKATGKPGEFDFNWRVANSCGMVATSSADPSLAPYDKLQPGPVSSTRKMGEDGEMEVEQQMAQGMEGLDKWGCVDGALILRGPAVEMELIPGGGDDQSLPAKEVDLE